ncbi:MAG: cation transporter [Thermoplasmata archaeon]|nr:cation transporter [Thermoplasmata archaeon]
MPDNSQDESFKEKDRWNMISIYLNGLLFISKLVVGIMTMAISIISDSIDSGIDVITSAMARYSVKKAHEPADEDHSYGHGKYENLSGLIQAIVIILIALAIILEAGRRMIVGVLLENLDIGIAIMVVSVITKLGLSQKMLGVAKKHESIAMEANACNLRADVWISLGVLISLVIIRLAGPYIENIEYIDPIFAIMIGLVIMRAAFGIAKRSSRDLLDGQLPPEELAVIQEVMARHKTDYLEYHRLRARKSGSERHIDMHLVVPKDISLEDAHEITDEIEKEIQARINNATVVIHVEPCLGECEACRNPGNINGYREKD